MLADVVQSLLQNVLELLRGKEGELPQELLRERLVGGLEVPEPTLKVVAESTRCESPLFEMLAQTIALSIYKPSQVGVGGPPRLHHAATIPQLLANSAKALERRTGVEPGSLGRIWLTPRHRRGKPSEHHPR